MEQFLPRCQTQYLVSLVLLLSLQAVCGLQIQQIVTNKKPGVSYEIARFIEKYIELAPSTDEVDKIKDMIQKANQGKHAAILITTFNGVPKTTKNLVQFSLLQSLHNLTGLTVNSIDPILQLAKDNTNGYCFWTILILRQLALLTRNWSLYPDMLSVTFRQGLLTVTSDTSFVDVGNFLMNSSKGAAAKYAILIFAGALRFQ